MTDAKTEILRRIRGALHDTPAPAPAERTYRRASDRPREEVVEMLEDRLVDYRAAVHHESPESLPGRIAELLGVSARYVVPAGLDPSWLPEDTAALEKDALLSSLDADRRSTLIAERQADGSLLFDVHLQGEKETVFLQFPGIEYPDHA